MFLQKRHPSDGGGQGTCRERWERVSERASERALWPRNAKGKIKLRRRKTKSEAGGRQRERENQYLALKRGLHQRCNYAKCVLFTRQQAMEISQPGGWSQIKTLWLQGIKNSKQMYPEFNIPPHIFWKKKKNIRWHLKATKASTLKVVLSLWPFKLLLDLKYNFISAWKCLPWFTWPIPCSFASENFVVLCQHSQILAHFIPFN